MKKQTLISILLVIIAIIVISYIYYVLYTDAINENREPEINIIGKIDGGNIILEHQGGTSVKFNELIINVTIYENTSKITEYNVSNDNGDNFWGIGESIFFYVGNVTNKNFSIDVSYEVSNELIMRGTIHNGKLEIEKP